MTTHPLYNTVANEIDLSHLSVCWTILVFNFSTTISKKHSWSLVSIVLFFNKTKAVFHTGKGTFSFADFDETINCAHNIRPPAFVGTEFWCDPQESRRSMLSSKAGSRNGQRRQKSEANSRNERNTKRMGQKKIGQQYKADYKSSHWWQPDKIRQTINSEDGKSWRPQK